MEAFVLSSPFLGHRGLCRHPPVRCAQRHPSRTVIFSKKKSSTPPSTSSNSEASGGFAGMAAGPGAPGRAPRTPLGRKGTDQGVSEADLENAKTDASETPRATRALGTKKPRAPPKLEKKTAADFIAEGVEDDMDTDGFVAEDIRFGIDDVADPFKVDEEVETEIRRESESESARANIGKTVDVMGDGGVTKKLVKPGDGDIVYQGADVTVEYTGTLSDGTTFDSSRSREGGFSFELGAGRVIKGWEAGVATMRRGEVATFDIAPQYAYGRRGMPPVIPGNATLTFEIELVEIKGGEKEDIKTVAEFNPEVARTPEEIAKDYDARLETQAERKKGMSLLDRFYIISPFASQTGERPPWWINPNITFVFILAFCGLGFYLLFIAGGIHIGYVDQPVDVNIFK